MDNKLIASKDACKRLKMTRQQIAYYVELGYLTKTARGLYKESDIEEFENLFALARAIGTSFKNVYEEKHGR
jgi:DNA-binding transcriptional MerR regulator